MDMRFYWIQDCVAQKQFNVTGAPDQQTLLTTSSSIILRHIIDGNDQHTYIVSIIFHHFCKGVLIQIHSRAEGSEPNDRSRANQQYWPMPMLILLVTSMIYWQGPLLLSSFYLQQCRLDWEQTLAQLVLPEVLEPVVPAEPEYVVVGARLRH
jgi:hypothetical protein